MSEQFLTEIAMICALSCLLPIIGMFFNFPFKGVMKGVKIENFEGFFALTIGNATGSLIGIISIL